MEPNNYIFFGLALIAEVIGTISGFGSSILFVPIAALFFDFHVVLGITAVFHIFSNLSKIFLFRKGIDKNITFKLGLPAIVFVVLGAMLTNVVATKYIEIFMSISLVLLSVFLFFMSDYKLAQTDKNLVAGGIISGFLAGLIGTGGAIRGLTMVAFNLEKNIFLATSAMIDMGVDLSRGAIYIWNGYFLKQHISLIPFLILISIIGSYIGKRLLQHINQKTFRLFALLLITATAIAQIVKLAN